MKDPAKFINITLCIPIPLKEALEADARSQDRSMTKVLTRMLRERYAIEQEPVTA